MPIAFIFLVLVFLEVAGFVAMANAVGLLGVFALIVLGIVAGGFIIRTIGLASVQRMQQRANAGETVGQELGGLVLGFLGGILIILPGFFTDLLGIAFLIKPIQTLIWPRYGRQMAGRMPEFRQSGDWQSPTRGPAAPNDNVVIDAEPTGSAEPQSDNASGDKRNPWGT
ncbi:MAG: FxsA family protein [Devosiaceae bacterium]